MSALSKLTTHAAPPITGDSVQSRIGWLDQVRLFDEVKKHAGAMEHIARIMDIKSYATGVSIIKEGEDGTDAFFLTQGKIKVLKTIAGGESFPVAVLEAKDHPFFGEAALLASDKRSATILTESDCVCLILHKKAFDAFCAEKPSWALPLVLKIARVVLERLHKSNNDVILLYNALVSEVKGWSA